MPAPTSVPVMGVTPTVFPSRETDAPEGVDTMVIHPTFGADEVVGRVVGTFVASVVGDFVGSVVGSFVGTVVAIFVVSFVGTKVVTVVASRVTPWILVGSVVTVPVGSAASTGSTQTVISRIHIRYGENFIS